MPGKNPYPSTPTGPAKDVGIATQHDTNPFPFPTKGIRAVGAGTITFQARDSASDVAHPVYDGERIDVDIKFLRDTGTDVVVIYYA